MKCTNYQTAGERKKVYLDNSATSWPKPEQVYQAVDYFARSIGANPGRSSYENALESGRVLLEARTLLAELFHAPSPSTIVLAFNATDALNMAIKGVLEPGDHVVTTSMEHNSVLRPLMGLSRKGVIKCTIVPANSQGLITSESIASAIEENTKLIVVNHVSNVTGTSAPVAEIGKLARERGIVFLVDAAQSAGNTPIDVQEMNIDILAFTGHKALLGYQGTGGLYLRPGLTLKPWREGGTGSRSESDLHPEFLPDRLEAGTHNTHGWAGVCAGVRFILETGVEKIKDHEWQLTQRLLTGLKLMPNIKLYGPEPNVERGPIVSFNLLGADGGEVGFELAERYGIMSRTGLHCAPHAHQSIGAYPEGTVRLSLSYFTTEEEIDYTLKSLEELARSLV